MPKNSPHNNPILELSENKFPVVGVGASAGGLSAFKEFVGGIPENSGMAYVLVQHLDPSHESMLSEILQKSTPLPVLEITDDIKVRPDHIYIIPSNKMLLASDGVLMLSQRPAPEKNKKNLPIDLFFNSLAVIHGSHSLGVVLSGTASDGTQGLKDIKSKGGITFAQDESSAEWPQMPNSAINAGAVDFILPPSEIPKKILDLIKNKNPKIQGQQGFSDEKDGTFQQILSLIRLRRNTDFTYYKENTIKRRILRRMVIKKYKSPEAYHKFLLENSKEIDLLYQDLLIPVTSFFRDTHVFENLCQSILPLLIEKKKESEPIRVWIAGCSTGQEAYSLAICIHEQLRKHRSHNPKKINNLNGFTSDVQVFASDISEPAISFARKGIYKEKDVENISPERLQEYFIKYDEGYQIKKEIRESCVFAIQNFLKDPPFGNMDLISCRNVLIYLQPYLQKKALTTFHYSLKQDGYLLLGKSENVGSVPGYFTDIDKKVKLFKKNNIPESFNIPTGIRNNAKKQEFKVNKPTPVKRTDFQGTADEILLKKYTPASVVINEAMDIVLFRGGTSNYLEQQSGSPSHNLMKMAKPGLAFELRNIIHKVKKDGKPLKKNHIFTHQNGDRQPITVEAMVLPKLVDPHYLIVLQPSVDTLKKPDKVQGSSKIDEKDLRIKELENELAQSREDMLGITQEQEAVNEELQSANEEFMSGSEELQSLNEELETSKEELQSTNEELTVTNQELGTLNFQLTEERNFARAIINTTRQPLIVLNGELEVITSNKAFHEAYCDKSGYTEGKRLYELNNNLWDIPKVRELLESILPKDKVVENFEVVHNFKRIGERSMILNAMEIGDNNLKNNLILLSIEDITERKVMARKLEDTQHQYKEMIYSSPSLIAILNGPEFRISIANEPFLNQFGKGEDIIGASYLEAVPELVDQGLGKILREVYKTGEPQYVHETPVKIIRNGKQELLYYNFGYQAQRNSKGGIEGVAILANEVTAQAELNKTIKESESRFHQMADLTPEKIICTDTSGEIYYFNKSWLDFTGLNQELLIAKGWEQFMHPEEITTTRRKWKQCIASGNAFEKEIRLRDKNDIYKWHLSRAVPVKDEDGKIKMWIGALTQIHKIKEEEERKESFLKLASHELKTPITSIKGYTQFLLERLRESKEVLPGSIPIIPSLERIDSQVTRLTRLISEMLDLSRVQESKLSLQKESFSLNQMVEESVQDVQYSSSSAKIKIDHKDQLMVNGDRDRISQVLINLITNAIKYSPNNKNIEVKVFQEGKDKACVSVKDQGIGIDRVDQKNIFKRFFRVTGKDEQTYSGLGIGLYLAKEIMIRHNGNLKVKSEKGEGSVFTFSLPLDKI
ncbi:chemotaxis protein CheB [Salinimicrobium xinjiangense]|uniref:chemotaxis protein CheB n=1 Tax=Salinimicrobium xinjiangense TaxID=438596 RepID=UPI000404029F|nr:chemotaxis protein CheB [Salinimicrobium xinjiangense]